MEEIASHDDLLMEKYLGGEELTIDEIKAAIRQATIDILICPVICGSAFKNKGVQNLLDAVIDYLPSPLDVPAIIGIDADTETEVERTASDSEPFCCPGVQDHDRPFRGPARFLPCILRRP